MYLNVISLPFLKGFVSVVVLWVQLWNHHYQLVLDLWRKNISPKYKTLCQLNKKDASPVSNDADEK